MAHKTHPLKIIEVANKFPNKKAAHFNNQTASIIVPTPIPPPTQRLARPLFNF